MNCRKLRAAAGVLAAVAALSAVPGTAALASSRTPAAPASLKVLFQGRMVSYASLDHKLGATACDDIRGPAKLTCYSSSTAMDKAILAAGGFAPQQAAQVARQLHVALPRHSPPRAGGTSCHPYVVIRLWSLKNGKGAVIALFCDYSNLGNVGWKGKAQSAHCYPCSIAANKAEDLYKQVRYQQLQERLNANRVYGSIPPPDSAKLAKLF